MAKDRSKLWVDIKADARQALSELDRLSSKTKEAAKDLQALNRQGGSGQGIFGRFRGGRNRGIGLPTPEEAARRPGFTGFLGPGAFGPLGAAMGSFQVGGPGGMAVIGGLVAITGLTSAMIAATEATKELAAKFMDLSTNFPELARVFNVRDSNKFIEEADKIRDKLGEDVAQRFLQNTMLIHGNRPDLIRALIQSGGKDIIADDRFTRSTANLGIKFQTSRRGALDFLGAAGDIYSRYVDNLSALIQAGMEEGVSGKPIGPSAAWTTNLPELIMRGREIRRINDQRIEDETRWAQDMASINNRNIKEQLAEVEQRERFQEALKEAADKEEAAIAGKERSEAKVKAINDKFLREMEQRRATEMNQRNRYRAMFGLDPALDILNEDNNRIIREHVQAFGGRFGIAIGAAAAAGQDISGIFARDATVKQQEAFQSQTLNSAAEVYRRVNEAANSIPAKQLEELRRQTAQLETLIQGFGQMLPGGFL